MVSIKNLSVATATLIITFSSKALADISETTTDFIVRAEGAESGVMNQFTLRSSEDLLTRNHDTLVDMEARESEDEIEERDVYDLEERSPSPIPTEDGKKGYYVQQVRKKKPRPRSVDEYLKARAPRRRRGGRRAGRRRPQSQDE